MNDRGKMEMKRKVERLLMNILNEETGKRKEKNEISREGKMKFLNQKEEIIKQYTT
jgi:hypothetical protein